MKHQAQGHDSIEDAGISTNIQIKTPAFTSASLQSIKCITKKGSSRSRYFSCYLELTLNPISRNVALAREIQRNPLLFLQKLFKILIFSIQESFWRGWGGGNIMAMKFGHSLLREIHWSLSLSSAKGEDFSVLLMLPVSCYWLSFLVVLLCVHLHILFLMSLHWNNVASFLKALLGSDLEVTDNKQSTDSCASDIVA